MLYISRKCPDVLLTVTKWCYSIAVALAWPQPSPKFVLDLSPDYSHWLEVVVYVWKVPFVRHRPSGIFCLCSGGFR